MSGGNKVITRSVNRRGLRSLELHLSRESYVAGRKLSGVVVLRLARPMGIRSISVSVCGREKPASSSHQDDRLAAAFFQRDALLSGREQPRLTSERISLAWNEFLARDPGRKLSAGEHIYPFSIALPSSLPPTYDGPAGEICYLIDARVQFLLGRSTSISTEIPIVTARRPGEVKPVELSYPTGNGGKECPLKISLYIPDSSLERGSALKGKLMMSGDSVPGATIVLETRESAKGVSRTPNQPVRTTTSVRCDPEESASPSGYDFELSIPPDAPLTVEGTAISVLWFLRITAHQSPPVELQTPVTVVEASSI